MRFLSGALIAIMWILGIFSVIALISVHWTLWNKYTFEFSADGLNFYLSQFSKYKELFAGTILIMATYFGLHRLTAATEANLLKEKSDRFAEWKAVVDSLLPEAEKDNPYLRREFIRARLNLYEHLHELNFRIENQAQLEQVFQRHFQGQVRFIEEMNEKHINLGGVYQNNTTSYSFDGFRFVLFGCVDHIYNGAITDLHRLYIAQMNPDRWVDPQAYQLAMNTYLRRPR